MNKVMILAILVAYKAFNDKSLTIRVNKGDGEYVVNKAIIDNIDGDNIIDIAVGVSTDNELEPAANKLIKAGYFPDLDNELPRGRIFLASREHDSTFGDYHLHIVVSGDSEWNKFIAFRDQLKNDSALRDEYMSLKNRLLVDTKADRREYKHLKANFIQKTLEKYSNKDAK